MGTLQLCACVETHTELGVGQLGAGGSVALTGRFRSAQSKCSEMIGKATFWKSK